MKYKIGIIGGSGAFATSFLLQKINEYSCRIHKAQTDNDFLHTVTVSTPLAYLDFKGNSQQHTLHHLLENVHQLESIGCNVIVMACNTLHEYWYALIENKKYNPTIILNLPEIVCSFIDNSHKNIGVLCSERSRLINIYQPFINSNSINNMSDKKIIYPSLSVQQDINHCIDSVIRFDSSQEVQEIFDNAVLHLFEQKVDSVILGCTELSLLHNNTRNTHSTIYDSVELLAIYLNQHFKEKNESL